MRLKEIETCSLESFLKIVKNGISELKFGKTVINYDHYWLCIRIGYALKDEYAYAYFREQLTKELRKFGITSTIVGFSEKFAINEANELRLKFLKKLEISIRTHLKNRKV